MADKQPSENIYNQIVKAYGECSSVQAISLVHGVSKMTVQRVLITEGLWESKRSREIVELAKQGKTAEEIAKELFLSLKCVQNYMPYKRGMRQECVTANAKIAKQKRERMRIAFEGQCGKFVSSKITDRIQIDEDMLRKERERFERMMKNMDKLFDKESRPDTSVKKYIPSVLKLRFELVNKDGSHLSLNGEEKAVLGKYAKMKDGFIREAIVPSGISLNALNYMIQRLFGWQNSHLHRFTLTKDTFNAITEQGDIKAWERLCGVLFRFPNEDYIDQYCADDYDGTQSFKTWLKNKYSGAELPFSVGDTYLDNQLQVEAFEKNRQNHDMMRSAETLDELIQAVDLGGDGEDLVERLSLLELLCPEYVTVFIDKWLLNISAETQNKQAMMVRCESLGGEYMELLDSISELRKRRITQTEIERIIRDGFRLTGIPKSPVEQVYVDNKKEIDYLVSNCRKILSAFEPKILPLTDTLLYRYDFGDGWCVKITCLDGYYINDSWDYPNEDGVVLGIADDIQAIKDWEFFDCREHKKIKGEYAELLRNVASKNVPVTEQGKYSAKYALTELLVCGSCGGSFRRTSKSAKGKTTYYWRCVSRIEHGKTYCKDSAGIEEQMLHEAICRCLSKMMANSGEVFSLIQSNLSYAVSGNNAALDVFSIEKQMNELKVDIQQMTELAARTEGNPERYEVELKKMFDQLVILRGKLDLAKSQAAQSDSVNAELARIMDILKQTDMNFTEFDDVTVRRLVECIQVCGNKKIIVTLKGGYQDEEELRRIEAA